MGKLLWGLKKIVGGAMKRGRHAAGEGEEAEGGPP